jgi:hypothetical protein
MTRSIRFTRWVLAALVAVSVMAAAGGQPPAGTPAGGKDPTLPTRAVGRVPAARSHGLFSPDGKYFLAVSDTEIHPYFLWDAATHKLVRKFVGPEKSGRAAPVRGRRDDGQQLVAVGWSLLDRGTGAAPRDQAGRRDDEAVRPDRDSRPGPPCEEGHPVPPRPETTS